MRKTRYGPLERRRRAISRIALYGTLVLSGVLAAFLVDLASAPLLPVDRTDWSATDWEILEEVRYLRDYVRIDTSEATGDVTEGARYLARLLEADGIEPHVEILGTGDANLWAVLEGDDPRAVVLHHHIDVSAAPDPERWGFPPFEGHIDGPWLVGRGAFDMKSIGIAQLEAFLQVARSGRRPKRSLVLLATSGEESGSDLGTLWVLDRHPELAGRFDLVLTEGGVVEGRGRDDFKYWGTEFAQKRFAVLSVCDRSVDRLKALREDLRGYGAAGPPERIADEVWAFLPHYAPTRDRDDFRRLLAEPERLLRDRAAFESMPGYVKAMFRTELRPLGIRSDEHGVYTLDVIVHMLPGTRFEDIEGEVLGSWLFHGFTVGVQTERSALHGSPPDHPALRTIADLVHEHRRGVPVGPMFLPWTATDARFFRARGIDSYGFSPFLVLTTDTIRVDRMNERIALPDFVDGVELYRQLVAKLVE